MKGWGDALVADLKRRGDPRVAPKKQATPASAEPKPRMNKTETRMAQLLEQDKRDGKILDWWFEPFSLRLAKRTHYRPDFLVAHPDHSIELIEVKGAYIRDRALVKPKVAAEMFPCFFFKLAQWEKGRWLWRSLSGAR